MQQPANSPDARVHLLIQGRVQGVGFRAATQDQARELGLVGWVRNLNDGRVEVLAEGRHDKVEALIAWCWRGPVFSQVADVSVVREEVQGDFKRFELRR